jgi:Fe-S cluster assembly iron-binding protein IscA
VLKLTSSASRHLVKLRKERGVDDRAGVRFVSKEGRVGLTFSLNPVKGDREMDSDAIKVYIAPEIAPALDESIIDARDEDGKTALVLRKQTTAAPRTAAPKVASTAS